MKPKIILFSVLILLPIINIYTQNKIPENFAKKLFNSIKNNKLEEDLLLSTNDKADKYDPVKSFFILLDSDYRKYLKTLSIDPSSKEAKEKSEDFLKNKWEHRHVLIDKTGKLKTFEKTLTTEIYKEFIKIQCKKTHNEAKNKGVDWSKSEFNKFDFIKEAKTDVSKSEKVSLVIYFTCNKRNYRLNVSDIYILKGKWKNFTLHKIIDVLKEKESIKNNTLEEYAKTIFSAIQDNNYDKVKGFLISPKDTIYNKGLKKDFKNKKYKDYTERCKKRFYNTCRAGKEFGIDWSKTKFERIYFREHQLESHPNKITLAIYFTYKDTSKNTNKSYGIRISKALKLGDKWKNLLIKPLF